MNVYNQGFTMPAKPKIPPGFVELLPGQDLKAGDAIYRHTFQQFIPFSESQIATAGTVLTGEIVIRYAQDGRRV